VSGCRSKVLKRLFSEKGFGLYGAIALLDKHLDFALGCVEFLFARG
jgi:hypothetical protein